MDLNSKPTYYKDYLQLEKLLDTQEPYSRKNGKECHDEMLFIITHQVYELWFKQILHELNFATKLLNQKFVTERSLVKSVAALARVEKIQGLLIQQLDVIETMTPMDFLEFRNLLVPASGFQSTQFREIEIILGLKLSTRKQNNDEFILGRLNEEDKKKLLQKEKQSILPDALEKWLERLPFTEKENFIFWEEYKDAVSSMLDEDYNTIKLNSFIDKETRVKQLANIQGTQKTFEALFDKEIYNSKKENGKISLSRKACLNALFIFLYRHEAVLILPFQLLTSLSNIDENFSRWRYRHALMAKRMLGTKMGTGGSSGHKYLKKTVEENRAFTDLVNLSSYLIPASKLPQLPNSIKKEMSYNYSTHINENTT